MKASRFTVIALILKSDIFYPRSLFSFFLAITCYFENDFPVKWDEFIFAWFNLVKIWMRFFFFKKRGWGGFREKFLKLQQSKCLIIHWGVEEPIGTRANGFGRKFLRANEIIIHEKSCICDLTNTHFQSWWCKYPSRFSS